MSQTINLFRIDRSWGTVTGFAATNRDFQSSTSSRLILALQEARVVSGDKPEDSPVSSHQLLEEKRCEGFVYELVLGGFAVPAVWQWPFNFDATLLSYMVPAELTIEWKVRWPKPIGDAIEGFRQYPFKTNPLWASKEGSRIWVEKTFLGVLRSDEDLAASAARPIWKVGTSWETNLPHGTLPHNLTLRDALQAAREMQAEADREEDYTRRFPRR